MSRKVAGDGPFATGLTVLLESTDGVGGADGGICDGDEVEERVGLGERSEDETRDGVICEDAGDQEGDPATTYSSPSSSSTLRLRPSEWWLEERYGMLSCEPGRG